MDSYVSIVVCTYNRAKYIRDCLEHLHQQSAAPETFEVIVIDNNSTDNTAEICRTALSSFSRKNFRFLNEPQQGLSYGRNRGIQEAKGSIIAFIDDDAFALPDYVAGIKTFFEHHPGVAAVGGKVIPIYEERRPEWMSEFLLTLVAAQNYGEHVQPFSKNKFPIGANMIFRKTVFSRYGNFNVNLGRKGTELNAGEEKDLFTRLRAAHESIYYSPHICVDHIIPLSRTTTDYIRRMGVGVGRSERIRISGGGWKAALGKFFSEVIKSGGTVVLMFFYFVTGRFAAGVMLLRFRSWVIQGLLQRA